MATKRNAVASAKTTKGSTKAKTAKVNKPTADAVDFADPLLTRAFAMLADETRGKILTVLQHGEANVGSIHEQIPGMTQPTCSHHLGKMLLAGVVLNRRDGKRVLYRANPEVLKRLKAAVSAL